MNIQKRENEGTVTLKLSGWLDTLSAPELGKAVEELGVPKALVLDFDEVEYIASSGLRQVVACYQKAKETNTDFSVVNVGSTVMSIFTLTGLDKKIRITAKE